MQNIPWIASMPSLVAKGQGECEGAEAPDEEVGVSGHASAEQPRRSGCSGAALVMALNSP
jgi:hypothetical protein